MNQSIQLSTRKKTYACAIFTQAPTHLNADFAVRAIDDQLVGCGIYKNDLVYARRFEEGETPKNGAIVVVSDFGRVSMWVFYQKDEVITLKSANPVFINLVFEDEKDGKPEILGEAVAVLHGLV